MNKVPALFLLSPKSLPLSKDTVDQLIEQLAINLNTARPGIKKLRTVDLTVLRSSKTQAKSKRILPATVSLLTAVSRVRKIRKRTVKPGPRHHSHNS